jgi:hypothetical protein
MLFSCNGKAPDGVKMYYVELKPRGRASQPPEPMMSAVVIELE